MTLIVKELTGSGVSNTSLSVTGELVDTATRKFLIYDDVGAADDTDISTVVLFESLPQIADLHPDIPNLRVTKRNVTRTEERSDAYNINYSYEYMPDEPDGIALVSESSEVTGQFVDVWRTKPTRPISLNNPSDDDIGGVKIDQAGTPTSILLKQQTYQTSFTHYGSIPVGTLYSATGKRNRTAWNGFEAGFLVYLGVSYQTKTASSYTRTDKFLYDDFAHLRQIVYSFDGDLNPKLDTDGHADVIRFVQPFPEVTNFDNLNIPIG